MRSAIPLLLFFSIACRTYPRAHSREELVQFYFTADDYDNFEWMEKLLTDDVRIKYLDLVVSKKFVLKRMRESKGVHENIRNKGGRKAGYYDVYFRNYILGYTLHGDTAECLVQGFAESVDGGMLMEEEKGQIRFQFRGDKISAILIKNIK